MSTHAHAGHTHPEFLKAFAVEKGPRSTVKITGEIPFVELEKERSYSLKALGQDLELKGFRKGHIPESVLVKHIGEMTILNEMAERTLASLYPHILHEHNLDAIGRPNVSITKLAPGNPFGFTLELAVLPEVILPDYKKIAGGVNKGKEDAKLTDKEIADAIERIQRQKLSYDRLQAKAAKGSSPVSSPKEEESREEDISKLPVPPLTDDYIKTLGAFDSVDAFKKQITEHLEREKKEEAMSKHRALLTEALIAGSTIDLADILVQSEINQMFGQMEEELKRAGLTVEGYLEHVKKTREDMVKEWTPAAEKRAKTQLILNEISKREKIDPREEDVERDIAGLISQYKDADPVRVRIYVESMLRNSEVMKLLEAQ